MALEQTGNTKAGVQGQNILLAKPMDLAMRSRVKDPVFKLADFGLAKIMPEGPDGAHYLTSRGSGM